MTKFITLICAMYLIDRVAFVVSIATDSIFIVIIILAITIDNKIVAWPIQDSMITMHASLCCLSSRYLHDNCVKWLYKIII